MTLVDPSVLAGFAHWSEAFEGRTPTLYRDTVGLVTIGVGCLADPVEIALRLPLHTHAGGLATESEIRAEWERVKSLPVGMRWQRYVADDALHLLEEDIDALVRQRLDEDAVVLTQRWPQFGDFPAPAQQALLALSWAVGPGASGSGLTGPTWPHLQAAVDAQRWEDAAQAGQLGPAYRARNEATASLFRQAAQVQLVSA